MPICRSPVHDPRADRGRLRDALRHQPPRTLPADGAHQATRHEVVSLRISSKVTILEALVKIFTSVPPLQMLVVVKVSVELEQMEVL